LHRNPPEFRDDFGINVGFATQTRGVVPHRPPIPAAKMPTTLLSCAARAKSMRKAYLPDRGWLGSPLVQRQLDRHGGTLAAVLSAVGVRQVRRRLGADTLMAAVARIERFGAEVIAKLPAKIRGIADIPPRVLASVAPPATVRCTPSTATRRVVRRVVTLSHAAETLAANSPAGAALTLATSQVIFP
jgi:hypothetical protein